MASHIFPGLVTDIRFALQLIQERGENCDTVGVVRAIVTRRLREIEAELAERSDSGVISLAELQNALQKLAEELESIRNQPQCLGN